MKRQFDHFPSTPRAPKDSPTKFLKGSDNESVPVSPIRNLAIGDDVQAKKIGVVVAGQPISNNNEEENKKESTNSSPMAMLHQRYPGVKDTLTFEAVIPSDSGKQQYFLCRLELMGHVFIGQGLTKKEAKQDMARMAIEVLPVPERQKKAKQKVKRLPPTMDRKVERILESARINDKTPTQVLYELIAAKKLGIKPNPCLKKVSPDDAKGEDVRFACTLSFVREGDSDSKEAMDAIIDASYESAEYTSKKLAVEDATKKALAAMFNMDITIFDILASKRLKAIVQNKNPVQAMRELCVKNGMKVEEESAVDGRTFTTIYKIADRTIKGESIVSKTESKRIAAIQVAKELFDIHLCSETQTGSEDAAMSEATGSSFVPPLRLLDRISDISGTPVFLELTATTPSFSVKCAFGKASVVAVGHTLDEAKGNAARAILGVLGVAIGDDATISESQYETVSDDGQPQREHSNKGQHAPFQMQCNAAWMGGYNEDNWAGGRIDGVGQNFFRGYSDFSHPLSHSFSRW